MGDPVMNENELAAIGEYVKSHIKEWIQEENPEPPFRERSPIEDRDIFLSERVVRVEEGIKHLGELQQQTLSIMQLQFEMVEKKFDMIDKRFERVDKRFEQVDKRFEMVDQKFSRITTLITVGFLFLGTLVTLFKFLIVPQSLLISSNSQKDIIWNPPAYCPAWISPLTRPGFYLIFT
ncbi:MAG: hypothetical protein JEY99_14000 [Spirochaetales bacterium]|nr:hypothetical protein [Spirochaetales bacterium]